MESFEEKVEDEALVLFDVDSTLIVPEDAILRPAADELLDELLGGDKVQNLPEGRRYVFREILLHAPHRLVDERSVGMIRALQERGIPVIAFTAAPSGKVGDVESVIDWRIEELRRFGFDFSSAFSNVGTREFPKDAEKEFPPIFKKGVLFTSLHSKGAVLKDFLQATGTQPKRILFVDDQMESIQSVKRAAEELGIDFLGFHYTAAEELPYDLDPNLAAFQVRHFFETGQWRSDQEERKPKVLYFDFGGVIARPSPQAQFNYLVEKVGFPEKAIRENPYFCWMQLHPSEVDYLSQKALEYQIDLNPEILEGYREVKRSSVCEIPGMLALVKSLRQMGYEVNLITNIQPENIDLIEPYLSSFDHLVHCPKAPGERKAAWEAEWSRHGLAPSRFLLIDDQEPNIKEARALGIQVIQFQNPESLLEELIRQRSDG